MLLCGSVDTFLDSGYSLPVSRCRVQPQPADSPIHISSRFSGELRSTDGKDLKLFGLMPETYEVDMLESDIKCELMEFGLVGGPQPYPCDSFSKIPCW